MIHARVTRAELRLLRRHVERTTTVRKRPGARTPQLGAMVEAYAPAERDDDGEIVHKRETLRCVILAVDSEPGRWVVSYRAGEVEPARFLRARPGMVKLTPNPDGTVTPDGDADYTTSVASAAHGEPECVPESWEREVARSREAGIPGRVHHLRRSGA